MGVVEIIENYQTLSGAPLTLEELFRVLLIPVVLLNPRPPQEVEEEKISEEIFEPFGLCPRR